jgi:hypothetical protein
MKEQNEGEWTGVQDARIILLVLHVLFVPPD